MLSAKNITKSYCNLNINGCFTSGLKSLIILICINFLGLQKINAQTYSSVTTDKEIYAFLNWMTKNEKKYKEEPKIKPKQVYNKIKKWEIENFVPNSKDTEKLIKDPYFYDYDLNYLFQKRPGTDTIFKKPDRTYLIQQFVSIKDSIWHLKFSKSKLLKKKNQKRPNYYSFSIPLFSINKQYVIVRKSYHCGSLCAYRGYYIYKKINNHKWKFITSVNVSIS